MHLVHGRSHRLQRQYVLAQSYTVIRQLSNRKNLRHCR